MIDQRSPWRKGMDMAIARIHSDAKLIRSLREEVEEQKEHGVRLMHGPDCEGCQSVRRMLRGSDA
jgi:hypothetical protein